MAQTVQHPPNLDAPRRAVTVRFEPSGRQVRVPRGTSLLEAARRAGLPVASACDRSAACGQCGMRVLESENAVARESTRESTVKARNRIDERLRLSCVLSVRGDLTVTTSYW